MSEEMMPTPRTDLFAKAHSGAPKEWAIHEYKCAIDFARQLERQNAELLAALRELVTTSDIDYEELGETEFQAAADRHDAAMKQARAAIARALG